MVALTYHAPDSLEEAVQLLSTARQPVKVLSGGTDLIIQMQDLTQDERLVVDVKKIPVCAPQIGQTTTFAWGRQ